ncbi:MAG TPA: hypothetical protein VIN05_04125 [Roseovarius sp.]
MVFRFWLFGFDASGSSRRSFPGYPYGPDFTYRESMDVCLKLAATVLAAASSTFYRAYRFRLLRRLLEAVLLPKPGERPSKEARENGHFECRLIAVTRSDQRLDLIITGDRDPGYGASNRLIGEVAVCLAHDLEKKALSGGYWTPAAAIADALVPRLIDNAGLDFRLVTENGDTFPVCSVLFGYKAQERHQRFDREGANRAK